MIFLLIQFSFFYSLPTSVHRFVVFLSTILFAHIPLCLTEYEYITVALLKCYADLEV